MKRRRPRKVDSWELIAGRKKEVRTDNMKTFLIFDLRFLIGRSRTTQVAGLCTRAKGPPLKKRQRAGALQDAGASSLMFHCKRMISSRLGSFLHVFRPVSQPQGFDFSPVTQKNRDKRFRGRKMKCEVNINRSLIGISGSHEFGGCEIFHGRRRPIKKAKFKMKNEGRFRDSSPRLLPFQRAGRGGIAHNKTQ